MIAVQVRGGWITLMPATLNVTDLVSAVLLAVSKMVLIAGVEELVFRGYFLQTLAPKLGTGIAALSSSLLWAMMHLPGMLSQGCPPVPLTVGIITFVILGVALSIGFLRNQNTLWFPSGLHYGYNLGYSLLGGLTTVRYLAPTWWAGHPAWAPESGVSGLLLASVILGTVWYSQRAIR